LARSTLLRVAAAAQQMGIWRCATQAGICAQMRMRRGSVETGDLRKIIPQNFNQISLQ